MRQATPVDALNVALALLENAVPEGNAGDVRTWPTWKAIRAHVQFAALARLNARLHSQHEIY